MSEPSMTVLGRVQPNYRGTWTSTTEYNKLDYVDYNGSSYICRIKGASGANQAPSDNSIYWQLVAHKGDTGTIQNPEIFVDTLPTGTPASASIVVEGPADNRKFTFLFDIPTGPIGPVGIESIDVDATRYSKDDPTIPLDPDADPWATAELNSSTHQLNMTFGIPPGHDGAGGVSKVDQVEPWDGNVQLNAVRYTPMPVALTDNQKLQARSNIQALIDPTEKQYGQFLTYGGEQSTNPRWTTTNILQVPVGGDTGQVVRKLEQSYGWTPSYELPLGGNIGAILVKTQNLDGKCAWIDPMSNNEIDAIINA